MATSDSYLREVVRFLRDEYLVEGPIALQPGGNHRRLAFEYAGNAIKLTLQNTGHDRGGAVAFKQQDIRRLLGEPPAKPTTQKRRLDDMMPEPIAIEARSHTVDVVGAHLRTADKVYHGSIAVYISPSNLDRTRMKISIPDGLYAAFGHAGALAVARLDDDTFQITPHPAAKRKTPCFHEIKTARGRVWEFAIENLTAVAEGAFGASPAEMILVDGSIVVRVLERRSVKVINAPVVQRSERAAHNGDVAGSNPAGSTNLPDRSALDPREVLAALRRVEAETPYRLVRVKDDDGGRWAFQAPRIE